MSTYRPIHIIEADDFDKTKLKFLTPQKKEFNGATTFMADAVYMVKGTEYSPMLKLPTHFCSGIYPQYDMTPKKNLTGYTAPVLLTTDPERPTKEEEAVLKVFKDIDDIAWKHYGTWATHDSELKEGEEDDALIPPTATSSYETSSRKGDRRCLKPTCDHPKYRPGPDGKRPPGVDKSRSKQFYAKLETFKANEKYVEKHPGTALGSIQVRSMIRGRKNRDLHPADLEGQPGNLTPAINIKSMYFGGHGSTPYQASVQLRLSQATFLPVKNERTFFMGEVPVDEDSSSDEEIDAAGDDSDSDDDFVPPTASKTAVEALRAKAAQENDSDHESEDADDKKEDTPPARTRRRRQR